MTTPQFSLGDSKCFIGVSGGVLGDVVVVWGEAVNRRDLSDHFLCSSMDGRMDGHSTSLTTDNDIFVETFTSVFLRFFCFATFVVVKVWGEGGGGGEGGDPAGEEENQPIRIGKRGFKILFLV